VLVTALWVAIVAVPLPVAVDAVRFYPVTDFQCFYTAARMVVLSEDPYDEGSWARELGGPTRNAAGMLRSPPCPGRYAYPLWSAVLLAPLAVLPGIVAATIWVAGLLAGVIVGVLLIWRVVRPQGSALVLGAVVITSLPFWLTLITAQVDGLMFGLIGAGLWWQVRGRSRAGAALALLAVKPHVVWLALPAIGVWLLARSTPALVAAGITTLVMLSLSLLARPGWIGEWLGEVVGSQRQAVSFNHTTTWQLVTGLGLPTWTAAIVVVPLIAMLAKVILRPSVPLVDVTAASLVAGLLASPYVGSYDLLLLAVAWGRILASEITAGGLRRVVLLVGLVVCASVLPWVLYAMSSKSLTASADESPISIAVIATAVVLWVALRAQAQPTGPLTQRMAVS
jgi:hypothetical protein